jgi:hypothetical protein
VQRVGYSCHKLAGSLAHHSGFREQVAFNCGDGGGQLGCYRMRGELSVFRTEPLQHIVLAVPLTLSDHILNLACL